MVPHQYESRSEMPMRTAGIAVVSRPTENPVMMLVAAPVSDASAISITGR